jgi:Fur family ferric uptake transcriptional regulator
MELSRIEQACIKIGLKMTDQRRVITRVLSDAVDHPDVEEVHRRSNSINPRISVATVYRTVRLLADEELIERHDFGDGRGRYEEATEDHHDHLIDLNSGKVVEFQNSEIERLQMAIAKEHGMKLVGHRLELYCVTEDNSNNK